MSEPTPAARRPSPGPPPDDAAEPVDAPTPAESPEPADVEASPTRTRSERLKAERSARDRRVRRLRLIMVAAIVVTVAATAASLVVGLSGDDKHAAKPSKSASSSVPAASGAVLAHPDRVTAFLAGATSDIGAVTAYDYRRLDDALAAGSNVTTGNYRRAFRAALTGDIAATARANHVTHDFEVLDLGIGSMNATGTRANVLIFGRQLATDTSHPHPQASIVTLMATIVRQGDRYLITELQQDTDAGLPPGSVELARAVEAGRAEVVNALTYTRSQFDSDLRRAQAGAMAPLVGELTRESDTTRAAMTKGQYDLTGVVVASAVRNASGDDVSLLVAAESSRVGASGSTVTAVRYKVDVRHVDGRWAVSRIEALSAQ